MSNIFNVPAIFSESEVKAPQLSLSIKRESINFEDKLKRHLFHGSIKHRGKDGRTYNFVDKNGEYVSSFLSPYNSKILDNIEPKVQNIVSTLIDKGYLTAASCQGHPEDNLNTRFVIIAFISDEERARFINTVDKFELPIYWYYNFLNFVELPKKPEVRDGYQISVSMHEDDIFDSIDQQRQAGYSQADLTRFWNIMFSRNYQAYYPVQMCICSMPGDVSLLTRVKTFFQWQLREYYTKKIEKSFQSLDSYNW
jgi:hypothetical protein